MNQDPGAGKQKPAAISSTTQLHDVTVVELDNGLRIIVREDHRSPVAVCQVWVRVGSNREPDDLRGWAHGIEHMLFKGTVRRGEGDFANEVAEAGGTTNAGTGYETTSYHIVVPARNLETACDILGDALLNSVFSPAALDPERQVLVHENHMYDDIPGGFGVTWKMGLNTAFDVSPYQYHIGGRDDELLSAPRDAIVDFYKSAYRLDNMTVVIVGDVKTDDAVELIRRRFHRPGGRQRPALPQPPTEAIRHETRLRVEYGDIKQAYAKMIFPALAETDRRRPVLSILRRILSEGRSCRLFRRVREEQELVTSIGLLAETGPREGVLMVDIETDPKRLVDAIRETARVLEELKHSPPDQNELDKTRVRVERSFLFGAESVQGQSSTIGYYESMGDLEGAFVLPERVASVSAENISELCRRLFRLDNLTLLVYLPENTDASAAGLPADADGLCVLLKDILSPGKGLTHEPMPTGTASATARGRRSTTRADAPFTETTLAGGLKVCLRVDHSLPVFSLGLFAPGGAGNETADQAGLSYLAQHIQIKGAGRLDAETIHRLIESEGATMSATVDRDYGGIYVSGLSHRLNPVLGWLGDVTCRPSFPGNELDRERRLALEELHALADESFQNAALHLRRMMYGDHPYGRPLLGRNESLPTIRREDLATHYHHYWVPRNVTAVVSGDVDPDDFLPRLEETLAGLAAGPSPTPARLSPIAPASGIVRETITRNMPQAVALAAWPGPPDTDTDRIGILMFKEVLNGQSGRLFDVLRNRHSLCYNTGLLSTAGYGQGFLAGYILTDPQSAEQAIEQLCTEVGRLRDEIVPDKEFERARAKLIGNLLIASQTNAARVARCGRDLIYGRGANEIPHLLEAISAATPVDIRHVARKYIDPENRYEVLLGV